MSVWHVPILIFKTECCKDLKLKRASFPRLIINQINKSLMFPLTSIIHWTRTLLKINTLTRRLLTNSWWCRKSLLMVFILSDYKINARTVSTWNEWHYSVIHISPFRATQRPFWLRILIELETQWLWKLPSRPPPFRGCLPRWRMMMILPPRCGWGAGILACRHMVCLASAPAGTSGFEANCFGDTTRLPLLLSTEKVVLSSIFSLWINMHLFSFFISFGEL